METWCWPRQYISMMSSGLILQKPWPEPMAIKEALSWLAWNKVVVECLVAVQAVRSSVTMVSPFGRVS